MRDIQVASPRPAERSALSACAYAEGYTRYTEEARTRCHGRPAAGRIVRGEARAGKSGENGTAQPAEQELRVMNEKRALNPREVI